MASNIFYQSTIFDNKRKKSIYYNRNHSYITRIFPKFFSLKVRSAYYTQEININFLFGNKHHHIQDCMTECKL